MKINDLCEACFVNLYDQGFKVLPIDGNFSVDRQTMVKLVKGDHQALKPFTWLEIKDYYITFLQMISNRYDFVSFTREDIDNIRIEYVDWEYYWSDDLISELGEPKYSKIYSISIIVTNKK